MATLALSIIFLLLGLIVLFFLMGCLWSGLAELLPAFNIKGLVRKKRLNKIATDLDKIDAAIDERNFPVAQSLILQSLIIESPPSGKFHHDTVAQHNFALFSKAVLLLDAADAQSRNLAVLEREFQTRASLLKLYSDATAARSKIAKKETTADSRQWASKEMDNKITSITDQLQTNGALIVQEMKSLLSAVQSGRKGSEVKYH